ncbi:MAG: sigma-54-dependent Fis family transcriptional regulator [Ignavibacteria bacterium RBG_13_36_8]|nr:MAG: sigma-54-dependent Fis family transcriptional regulator [Ignavibacteria bacterium RBG_13_36_8]
MMATKNGTILVIDDNQGILDSLKFSLKDEFQEILTIKSPTSIPKVMRENSVDIFLLDMNFTPGVNDGREGMMWLKLILESDPDAVVIPITAYGDVELAVKAIKQGATDFIVKPWDTEKLIATIKSAHKLRLSKMEVKSLKEKQKQLSHDIEKDHQTLIFSSDAMCKVISTVEKVAKTDANVLIIGENGTGKELIAHEIHRRSLRAREVMISVDMASLSETLFESELFGHVKGAFTDAKEDRAGRFETASSGTLFLDEIGNLPISLQAKLLAALQNRAVYRVGSNKPIPIDIRLLCATNKNLHAMIEKNLFREDLLYRINTIHIEVPPLRERGEDIILLTETFLKKYAKKYDKPLLRITSKAYDKLMQYRWPGNVRELLHTIEKVVILCEGDSLRPEDFFFDLDNKTSREESALLKLEDVEKETIRKALLKYQGNLSQTARELGITRSTLYSKIEKYGL